jgi:hypothetical protein
MAATSQQWNAAFRSADDGRPNALADLVGTEVIPPYAREPLAAFIRKARIKNTGRASQRNDAGHTPTQEKQADAYEKYWRLEPVHGPDEALRRTVTKDVPQNVLKRVIVRSVKPANVVLRARGII